MKRDICKTVLLLLAMIFITPTIGAAWKKYSVTNVDGKVTTVYDLLEPSWRIDPEIYEENHPVRDVFLGEIVGMNEDLWLALGVEESEPVFIYNKADILYPNKLAGKIRPILYYFEVYELESVYYVKVLYTLKPRPTETSEKYTAYYQYTALTPEAIEGIHAWAKEVDKILY